MAQDGPGGTRPPPSPRRSALIGALIYATTGVLWIVSSDWFLERIAPGADAMATLQTWKGSLFVAATAGILYLVLRTQFARRARESERLRVASERLRSHVENTPLAVIEWNADFRVERWSPRAEELFGWTEAELLGQRWADWGFIVPEDLGTVEELISRSLREGAEGSVSVNRNFRKDGSVVWCEWYNSWIRDADGHVVSMMSLAHDITAEREAAREVRRLNRDLEARVHRRTSELAQANADLKGLTYSISHDLRAPVRAVVGFGEIIQRRHRHALPDEGRRYLDNILDAGRQMDNLIDGLLEFGRIDSGGLELVFLDPVRVIAGVLEDLQVALEGPSATVHIDPDLPRVRADKTALRRILQNLFENAYKYGPTDGTLALHVTGSRNEMDAPQLVIADNGPGIPPEHRERVFGLFERLHAREEVEGSGLGLAVVRRSMELMGGSVRVEDWNRPGGGGSSVGGGAAFVLTFPGEEVTNLDRNGRGT